MNFICSSLSNFYQISSNIFMGSKNLLNNVDPSTLKKVIILGLLVLGGSSACAQTISMIQVSGNSALAICSPHQIQPIIPIDIRNILLLDSDIQLHSIKLKKGTDEALYRIENAEKLQQQRWDWIQSSPEKYVNLLKRAGISEESIIAMSSRIYPLGFKSKKQYENYKIDLFETLKQISYKTGIKNFRVVEQGSYVTGYSSSPMKGDRTIPNHIFNDYSDLDLRITADNISNYLTSNNINFNEKSHYPNLIEPDSLMKVFPTLHDFTMRWMTKIGRNLQITITKVPYREFEPNPWDHELFEY